jgi:alkane 1-monooxygenase
LYLTLGSAVGSAYLVQAAVAMLLLEFVNYIEHYGLVRAKGEKVGAHHAWQSDRISSRFTLFELSRHSDHHLKAYKPFHTLDSHESPFFLPSGYFGMYYVALIPPLWFRIMNPIIEKHQGQSI